MKNTQTFHSLPVYPIVVLSICVCSLSRLSQISLNAKIRNVCEKKVVYANERVSRNVCLTILAKKQDGTRLENKTPREIMNMDRKLTEFKTPLKVMLAAELKACQHCKKNNNYLAKQQTSKVLFTKITWILASLENNQSFVRVSVRDH